MNNDDTFFADTPRLWDIDIKWKQILKFAVFAAAVVLLSDFRSTQGGLYWVAKGLIACMLLVSIFAPVCLGVIIFFVLTLVGIDVFQASAERITAGLVTTASIWNLYIGPIRPSWIIALAGLAHLIKIGHLKFERTVKCALVWFATVPIITAFIYENYTSPAAKVQGVVDIKVGVMLLLTIILFRSFLSKNPQHIATLIAAFIGCLLSRHLIDLVYWFLNYGSVQAGVVRISMDSVKGCVIFLLLYSIYLTFGEKRLLLGPVVGIGSCLLLIVYAQRGNWVTAALGCLALIWILGFKRGVIAIPTMVIVVLGSILFLRAVRPHTAWVLARRAETLGTIERSGNVFERTDPLRYTSIVNSLDTSWHRGAILLGNGYAAHYKDEVIPFPVELVGAFDKYSAESGEFFRIHNYVFHMLFKHGLVGLIIITALWVVPGWQCYKILRYNPTLMNGILACLVAFLITAILQFYPTGKGLFVSGFIIALLYSISEQYNFSQTYAIEEEQYDALQYQQ